MLFLALLASGAAVSAVQPPEQPPTGPPPPAEEPPGDPEAQPPTGESSEAPPEGAEGQATEPGAVPPEGEVVEGEVPAEGAVGEGEDQQAEGGEGEDREGEAGEGEEEDEEEPVGPRPDTAVAPAGILPGDLLRIPALDPGSPVVEALPLDHGAAVRTASGVVAVIPDDREEPRWTASAGAVLLATANDELIALDREGTISAYRIGDGELLTSFPTGRPIEGSPVAAALPSGVVAWVSGPALVGFAPGTGEPVFEIGPLPDGAEPVAASPARWPETGRGDPADGGGRDLLLLSLGESGIAAAAAEPTGQADIAWTALDAGPVVAPILADVERDLAVAAEAGGTLRAFRLRDGRSRWRWRLGEGFDHPPLASGERFYAATRANSLYAFDRDGGRERWRTALPGRAAASPIRLAGAVVIATRDGLVLEVNPVTGLFIGTYRTLDAEITGVVAARADEVSERGWRARRLYLGLRDGSLAILAPRTGASRSARSSTGDPAAP